MAVADGTIKQGSSGAGGNTVWLYADHGVSYFYAHLDSFAAGQWSGQWVARGTVIGYMGDTGNPAPGRLSPPLRPLPQRHGRGEPLPHAGAPLLKPGRDGIGWRPSPRCHP